MAQVDLGYAVRVARAAAEVPGMHLARVMSRRGAAIGIVAGDGSSSAFADDPLLASLSQDALTTTVVVSAVTFASAFLMTWAVAKTMGVRR